MNKKSRAKFGKFIKRVQSFRDNFITFGTSFFGLLGFVLSMFALTFVFVILEIEIPIVMNYLIFAFRSWITLTTIIIFISFALSIIYKNKKELEMKVFGYFDDFLEFILELPLWIKII